MSLRRSLTPAWLFVLLFIYPIPHTIALRNVLLLIGLVGLPIALMRKQQGQPVALLWPKSVRIALATLIALTLWQLTQSGFISARPEEAIGLWRGDWLVALLALTAGFLAQRYVAHGSLSSVAILALGAHIVWVLAYQMWIAFVDGRPALGFTPFAQKDYHSMIVTTLLALVAGELVARGRGITSITVLSTRALWVLASLTLVAGVTIQARNAALVSIALVVISVFTFALKSKHRLVAPTLLGCSLVIVGVGIAGINSDHRWAGFRDAVAAGWHPEANTSWLTDSRDNWPRTAAGQPVEESAYLRTAWARVGLEQIAQHPWGLGYGHKAFGWAVAEAYSVKTGIESSHSGLIDFTLANGLPALALWLLICAALVHAGWQAGFRNGNAAGFVLLLTIAAYLMRCAVDGHFSGWRLELFALICGVLIAHGRIRRTTR